MSFTETELREILIKQFMETSILSSNTEINTNINLELPPPSGIPQSGINNNEPEIEMNTHFTYLADSQLSKEFNIDTLSSDTTIILCCYSVNTDISIPFLQYLVIQNDNNEYSFPKTILNIKNINTIRENSNKIQDIEENVSINDEINDEILNQCSLLITQNIETELNDEYRGYIQQANNLYVFIDCTNIMFNDNINIKYAIIDEIINKQQILGGDINRELIELFNNPIITNITDINRNIIPYPIIGYICNKNEHGVYANNYTSNNQTTSLINSSIYDDNYEDLYVFSLEPINKDYNNINKYALFKTENNNVVIEQNNTAEILYGFNSNNNFIIL
jgi:hypothetical protein